MVPRVQVMQSSSARLWAAPLTEGRRAAGDGGSPRGADAVAGVAVRHPGAGGQRTPRRVGPDAARPYSRRIPERAKTYGPPAAVTTLLEGSCLAPPDRLPALAAAAGRMLGVGIYLVDYDQCRLVPASRPVPPRGPFSAGTLSTGVTRAAGRRRGRGRPPSRRSRPAGCPGAGRVSPSVYVQRFLLSPVTCHLSAGGCVVFPRSGNPGSGRSAPDRPSR